MFGHVTIHKPELKVRDYERYRSYYCGLCRTLGKRYGITGKLLLSYDMTFLAILFSGLYELEGSGKRMICLLHPTRRQTGLCNPATEYAADMTMLLTYHKLLDDWEDDRRLTALFTSRWFLRRYRRVRAEYPRQCAAVEDGMHSLSQAERRGETSADVVSGLFGSILSEIFVWHEDEWSDTLREIGFYLGKYIYLADAYVDMEEDRKNRSYNPLWTWYQSRTEEEFHHFCEQQFNLIMSVCARAFERLPILQEAELLRNILYAGVWTRFYQARNKRMEETHGSI